MFGFISSSSFQNTKRFLQIQSLAPDIASRSSGRFQLRRAITPNPCIVCGIRGYRCVRLVKGFVAAHSVRRLDPQISDNRRISSRLRRGSSSPVRTSVVVPRVSSFFPSAQGLPHSPLTFPGGGAHPPPFTLLGGVPFPLSGDGGRAPRAPCGRARPGQPDPTSPAQPPPFPLLFFPWMGGRR
jgi:hypothetical protein